MITLKDLKEQGFTLTKDEATELLPFIGHISKYGESVENVYDENLVTELKPAKKKTKEVIAEPVAEAPVATPEVENNG